MARLNIICFVLVGVYHPVRSLISDLVLKRNLNVTENRTLQLDYQVNDSNYPGLEGTVVLHFNITILPVHIRFPNITYTFKLTRRASVYVQVFITISFTFFRVLFS